MLMSSGDRDQTGSAMMRQTPTTRTAQLTSTIEPMGSLDLGNR
jgi:hypothetical protein